jgi:Parkin co-regulated protein
LFVQFCYVLELHLESSSGHECSQLLSLCVVPTNKCTRLRETNGFDVWSKKASGRDQKELDSMLTVHAYGLFRLFFPAPHTGEAFVPYLRHFLPALNLFRGKNVNKLDRIDYNRVGRLGDVIDQTLMMLERCGGPNAYVNIKYAIPTYESCVNN